MATTFHTVTIVLLVCCLAHMAAAQWNYGRCTATPKSNSRMINYQGSIMSDRDGWQSNVPYPANESCVWTIGCPGNLYLALDYSIHASPQEQLLIKTMMNVVLKNETGQYWHRKPLLGHMMLMVQWVSGPHGGKGGFSLRWQCVRRPFCSDNSTTSEAVGMYGVIQTDKDGSGQKSTYYDHEKCTWSARCAYPGYKIIPTLSVQLSSTQDEILLANGRNRSQIIAKIDRTTPNLSQYVPPGFQQHSFTSMYVMFNTNHFGAHYGFTLNWRCVNASIPNTHPTDDYSSIASLHCPPTHPHKCMKDMCARYSTQCNIRCPLGQFQCWNTSCVVDNSQCSCPPHRPIRCSNDRCVNHEYFCTTRCSSPKSFKCWDGSCAATPGNCTCPPRSPKRCSVVSIKAAINASTSVDTTSTQLRLASSNEINTWTSVSKGVCVDDVRKCAFNCPAHKTLCWNNKCLPHASYCACRPEAPYRCWNRQCVEHRQNCTCPRGLKMCSNGYCRYNCVPPKPARCPWRTPFRCEDNSCKRYKKQCPCLSRNDTLPDVRMSNVADLVPFNNWIRVSASGRWSPCSVDNRKDLDYCWTLSNPLTGAEILKCCNDQRYVAITPEMGPFVNRSTRVYCHNRYFSIPPSAFNIGYSFALNVLVSTPSGKQDEAEDSFTIGKSSVSVNVVPPYSCVPATRSRLYLRFVVADYPVARDAIQWKCCKVTGEKSTGSPSACAACPAPFDKFDETKNYLLFQKDAESLLPEGTYNFTATYQKVFSDFGIIKIRPAKTPAVKIYGGWKRKVLWCDQKVNLYASIRAERGTKYTVQWFVNDTELAGFTGRHAKIPGEKLTCGAENKIRVVVTQASLTGEAEVTVSPKAKLQGTCSVVLATTNKNNEPQEGNIEAGESRLVHNTEGWSEDGTRFRFGWYQKNPNAQENGKKPLRKVYTSSYFRTSPQIELTAPVQTGNPASEETTFFTEVWYKGDPRAGYSECKVTIYASATSTETLLAISASSLTSDVAKRDVTSTAKTANRMTTVAQMGNTSVKVETRNSVVAALATAMTDTDITTSITSSVRTNIVATLDEMPIGEKEVGRGRTKEDDETEGKMLGVLKKVIEPGDGEDEELDTEEEGGTIMNILGRMKPTPDVASTLNTFASVTMGKVPAGSKVALSTNTHSVTAATYPMEDVDGSGVNCSSESGAEMKIPSSFSLTTVAQSAVMISLGVTEQKVNPFGNAGLPKGTNVSSTICDFTISADGSAASIANLEEPLGISLPTTAKPPKGYKYKCRYYQHTTKTWSSTGVNFVSFDEVKMKIVCNTTHLSTFAAVLEPEVSMPPEETTIATENTEATGTATVLNLQNPTGTEAAANQASVTSAAQATNANTNVAVTGTNQGTSAATNAAQGTNAATNGQQSQSTGTSNANAVATTTAATNVAGTVAATQAGSTQAPAGTTNAPNANNTSGGNAAAAAVVNEGFTISTTNGMLLLGVAVIIICVAASPFIIKKCKPQGQQHDPSQQDPRMLMEEEMEQGLLSRVPQDQSLNPLLQGSHQV